MVYTKVGTAALANYKSSMWESSHTLSFTAALAIHARLEACTPPLYVSHFGSCHLQLSW